MRGKLRCPELVALTGSQINHVMTELEAYVALRDENTGIEVRAWAAHPFVRTLNAGLVL